MSTSEAVEFDLNGYDFRDELSRALECTPISDLNADGTALNSLDTYEGLDELASKPPDTLVTVDNDIGPGNVFTDDVAAYPTLIRQAWETVFPFLDSATIDKYARESFEHETAHAAAAIKLGIAVSYGIRIMKVRLPDHRMGVMIFSSIHHGSEQISKADMAFIAASPENPSESDRHLVRTLGYASCRDALESHPMISVPSAVIE
jgi:hypothetical protein